MNVRQGISLLVIGAIHLVFLVGLIANESINIGLQSAILFSLVLLIIGYVKIPRSSANHSKSEIIFVPFVIAAAGILTYYVSVGLHFGPVIASAGIGFIASYIPSVSNTPFAKSLAVPIYCGTFVGMCSSIVATDYFFVSYAGLIAGIIFLLARDAMNGLGGKLGTIAFGGVVIASLIFSLI